MDEHVEALERALGDAEAECAALRAQNEAFAAEKDRWVGGVRALNERIREALALCDPCDFDCGDPECALAREVQEALNPG